MREQGAGTGSSSSYSRPGLVRSRRRATQTALPSKTCRWLAALSARAGPEARRDRSSRRQPVGPMGSSKRLSFGTRAVQSSARPDRPGHPHCPCGSCALGACSMTCAVAGRVQIALSPGCPSGRVRGSTRDPEEGSSAHQLCLRHKWMTKPITRLSTWGKEHGDLYRNPAVGSSTIVEYVYAASERCLTSERCRSVTTTLFPA